MAGGLNKLTDRKLKAIHGVPCQKPYKLSDGAGLLISVSAKGSISWAFKYRLGGRESEAIILTLGKYPDMGLKQARTPAIIVVIGLPMVKIPACSSISLWKKALNQ